ncbi:MAG: tetratricopeptide repeat protein [Pseudomonadota bacterium]
MVDEMMTDEERAEALKRWFQENGAVLVMGVVVGLGGLFGFQWYKDSRESNLEAASIVYQDVLDALEREDLDQVQSLAAQLGEQFASSPYETQALFAAARLQVDAGDLAGAAGTLERAIAEESDGSIVEVGRSRLVRVLLSDERAREALALLDANAPSETFKPRHLELRGDALSQLGRTEAARTAYTDALAVLASSGASSSGALELKLAALGPAPEVDTDVTESAADDAES